MAVHCDVEREHQNVDVYRHCAISRSWSFRRPRIHVIFVNEIFFNTCKSTEKQLTCGVQASFSIWCYQEIIHSNQTSKQTISRTLYNPSFIQLGWTHQRDHKSKNWIQRGYMELYLRRSERFDNESPWKGLQEKILTIPGDESSLDCECMRKF